MKNRFNIDIIDIVDDKDILNLLVKYLNSDIKDNRFWYSNPEYLVIYYGDYINKYSLRITINNFNGKDIITEVSHVFVNENIFKRVLKYYKIRKICKGIKK